MASNNPESRIVPRWFSALARNLNKDRLFELPGDIINSSKILFIDSGDIVDLLFIYPVLEYFRKHHSNIKTTMVVKESHADIARNMLPVQSVITYHEENLKIYKSAFLNLIKKIKRMYFESAIVLSRKVSFERYLLAYFSGAAARIGFSTQLSFPFINCEMMLSDNGYQGEKISRIISAIGLKSDQNISRIELNEKEVNRARQLIHFRKPEKDVMTIGVDPGKGKEKHYVIPEIVAYLANNVSARRKAKFLILTEPWDKMAVKKFSGELKSEVLDITPSGANETITLLSTCDLFISGNTSLFHFAAAMGVPTIGLFTEHETGKWVPSYDNVRIFRGKKGEKLSLKAFFSIVEEVLY